MLTSQDIVCTLHFSLIIKYNQGISIKLNDESHKSACKYLQIIGHTADTTVKFQVMWMSLNLKAKNQGIKTVGIRNSRVRF